MAISIELTSENERRLDSLSKRSKYSRDEALRWVIENGLEDLEEYCAAAEIVERIDKGQEEIFSSDKVKKALGLDS